MSRSDVIVFYGSAVVMMVLAFVGAWWLSSQPPLGTCIPGADPPIKLARCESVQP